MVGNVFLSYGIQYFSSLYFLCIAGMQKLFLHVCEKEI